MTIPAIFQQFYFHLRENVLTQFVVKKQFWEDATPALIHTSYRYEDIFIYPFIRDNSRYKWIYK